MPTAAAIDHTTNAAAQGIAWLCQAGIAIGRRFLGTAEPAAMAMLLLARCFPCRFHSAENLCQCMW